MKKICYITTLSGTLKTFVLPVAEYLHQHTDWEIFMICSENNEFASMLPSYIHYIPVSMKRGINWAGITAMMKMVKIFKKEKFDLIQYSTPNASLYASLAGFIAGVPTRLYCQWGMAYVSFHGLKRKLFKMEEKFVCKLSTWIEPDSKSNLKFAHEQKLYPHKKGSVIWNGSACGVDLKKFDISKKKEYRRAIREKLAVTEEAFVFGFVGRITRDKGINELFAAFKSLKMKYENVYLLMVGSKELDNTVDQALYQWSQQDERIIYAGYTNFVEQYLSAMDCYVLPSYREGFGMSVVEAEAMGVPVIVTDIPGPTDAMQNEATGLIVEKADSQKLLEAMEKLYGSKELCNVFGNAGKKFAEENFEQSELCRYILEDRKKLLRV